MIGIKLALAGFIAGLFFTFSTPPQVNVPDYYGDEIQKERIVDEEDTNEGIAGGFRPMSHIKKETAKK